MNLLEFNTLRRFFGMASVSALKKLKSSDFGVILSENLELLIEACSIFMLTEQR